MDVHKRHAAATRVIRIVLQARTGSSRLPKKILANLAGEPMLVHVVRRLQSTWDFLPAPMRRAAIERRLCCELHVATTDGADDEATAELCALLGVPCFRGPRDDVLSRYLAATADLADGDVVVRATADNPLYCPRRTAKIIALHLDRGGEYTYVEDLSYAVPEVVGVGALRRMATMPLDDYCREHVTPGFRRNPEEFRVCRLPPDWEGLRPEIRLTVDTADDLERVRSLFAALGNRGDFSLEEAYSASHAMPRSSSPLCDAKSDRIRPCDASRELLMP
ncbi:MAG: hypothetical protein HYS13_07840 [Planctomycetia bacterium]|nr:hypothetical protein [Planctomycetia bacterium]